MASGFLYLCRSGAPAVIDWYSRFILSWRLSNTLLADFCVDALQEALTKWGKPEIFNTDQGSQFTSQMFLKPLIDNEIKISMDGKGRALDNIFIERFWRTVKYERSAVAAYLPESLRRWSGVAQWIAGVFPVLQPRPEAPVVKLSDAWGVVYKRGGKGGKYNFAPRRHQFRLTQNLSKIWGAP